jgi:poly [ADP-ribose] polymerase 2/3/4
MPRTVRLVCVSPDNNNKFYNMTELSNGTFEVHYGRVGVTDSKKIYPMSDWDKKYREKLRGHDGQPGYTDVTELLSVQKDHASTSTSKIAGASVAVQSIVDFLLSCARGVIDQNYTVAIADVTQKQIDTAQEILDGLAATSQKRWLRESINETLLSLYHIIPRKMKNTKLFLIQADDDNPKDTLQKLISAEQDLLDVMHGQVKTQARTTADASPEMKLDIDLREAIAPEIDEIKKNTDFNLTSASRVLRVANHATEIAYDNYYASQASSKKMLLYHGSRNENWWSILNSGLKIRPTNAVHTGSMFGDGLYFANKARKSIGYTSLDGSYWASGSSHKAYLAIYQVNVGKQWLIQRSDSSLNLSKVRRNGYDTVYAKGGIDLVNDEFIAYEAERCTIKYLIELKH